MNIYERNYSLLIKVIDLNDLQKKGYLKYTSDGYMDLSCDFLGKYDDGIIKIALAHNFAMNNDLCCDPDVEIKIDTIKKTAEPLTYQNDGLGVFQKVYSDGNILSKSVRNQLNIFLYQWLTNILSQDYKKADE